MAHWIYVSQTACHAKDRKKAIDKLGDFDCVCNPEIMCAFIYALNDCDERVREEAAEEIRGQTKKNPCCCNDKVVAALTCALSDCDKSVRKEAEKALRTCGYDVKDCCDQGCCTACNSCGGVAPSCGAPTTGHEPAPAPAEGGETAPAPAPAPAPAAAEPEAYFPSRLKNQTTKVPSRRTNSLSNLFGLRG